MEKLLRKGAEADIYVGDWFGEEVIKKIRQPRAFRHPKLDDEIRKHRTMREAYLLSEARHSGVKTPFVYYVDPKGEIVMEFVQGTRFKDALSEWSFEKLELLCIELGRCIAKLHKGSIVHGDLSTSNFIVTGDEELTFIDFGLALTSQRLEDMAVDLHLVKEILRSAHGKVWERVFQLVVKGYGEVSGESRVKAIQGKIKEIERRGRYARVE